MNSNPLTKEIIKTIETQLERHSSAHPKEEAIRTAANVVLGGVQVKKADSQLTERDVDEIVAAFNAASGYIFGYDFSSNRFTYPPELVIADE